MPVVPPIAVPLPGQVFWSVEDVLNFARLLINDMQGSTAGQELADDNPYTIWLLNLSYAKLQNALEDTNCEAVTYAEAIVGPLAAAPAIYYDPNTQVRLGYDGYWDGTNETDPSVILPGDLLQPLALWERPSGSTQPFIPMRQKLGGLEARWGVGYSYGGPRFGLWEFRSNGGVPAIYMPGSQVVNEIRIRYIPSLAMLAINDEDGNPMQVPLARAGEALAYGIAADWAEIRGAANAATLRAGYKEQVQTISNKSAKREGAANQRARGYGFARHPRRRFW